MINRSPLFKERMRIVRFLMLLSLPMLLFIAPVTQEFTFWHELMELLAQPRMVLLTMRDASGFILALLLIETLCALRISAMLPAWIILP